MIKHLLLVFVGGGLGSSLRYGIGRYLNTSINAFPYGTFLVNMLGSLLIGVLLGIAAKNESISQNTMLLLATGFCGGFTTFSTFAYENYSFLKNGDIGLFAIYSFASLAIGFAFVFFGIWLVKFL